MDKHKIGQIGEKIATRYLEKKGYKILEKNFSYYTQGRKKLGEIDIIAKDKNTIVFVEVKSENILYKNFFDPTDKVNFLKLRRIQKVGEIWLSKNRLQNQPFRIDILTILLDFQKRKAKVLHLENA